MQLVRRFRIPAIFCAVAVLLCELISHPFAEMGISDDLAYIVSAHKLATTGHIVYVGAAAAMLGSQLYIGAAMIKIFGFSFSAVRMGTLLVAMVIAFLLQRTMVRCNINERNATIGTLALVLSPLYLMLSVTFMSDIYGLFAVVLCLYCCVRALQAATSSRTIAWLGIAVLTNAIFGTARQIAWLGVLVMVPSTLWLLRRKRRVLLAGAAFALAGAIFIFGCMVWFHRQPYSLGLPSGGGRFSVAHTLGQFSHTFLDIPFLLLPLMAVFLPEIRKGSRRVIAVISMVSLGYVLLAIHWRHSHPDFLLEPTQGAQGDWVGLHGIHEGMSLHGTPPLFLHPSLQILLTIVSVGGLFGLIASLLRSSRGLPYADPSHRLSWHKLAVLLAPFTIAYCVLLIPSATGLLFDRYTLELLLVLVICLIRYYQDRIHPGIPLGLVILIGVIAIYGIAMTHNNFALYRARVVLAAEIRAAGTPDTSVDNGFEYNFNVELKHADHINDRGILSPANTFIPSIPLLPGTCDMLWQEKTPHIRPIYGISFDPKACYGPAPFPPMRYSRWLSSQPGILYVVRYLPPSSYLTGSGKSSFAH